MLKLVIPEMELFDERTNEFLIINETTLTLEHSLLSVSKWEAKWKKPFLSKDQKEDRELFDYIRCMTLTQNVNPLIYTNLPKSAIDKIINYIDDSMTATWFGDNSESSKRPSSRIVTSELIYYWMVAYNIPFECEKWHLNRLMTLIRICGIENSPKKKMSKSEIMSRNRALNAARRKAHGIKG